MNDRPRSEPNQDVSATVLVSLIPDLAGGQGHILSYHQAVSQAANLIGWQHQAVTAPDPIVTELPATWKPALGTANLERQVPALLKPFRWVSISRWAMRLAAYLRREAIGDTHQTIILLERFITLQLLALAIALLLVPRDRLSIWLLYRRDTHKLRIRFVYKWLNRLIKALLPPGRLCLLTDSELLAKCLSEYFKERVAVMPIPHTEVLESDVPLPQTQGIVCWFAGEPRLEKGLVVIQALVQRTAPEAAQLCLVAAQSSQLQATPGGVQVCLIPDRLTRSDYVQWLLTSHLVLLPYDAAAYSERTSGVFVECIMAGKIPVVTANTWMAAELLKYGLHQLIVDWQSPTIISTLYRLANDPELPDQIRVMQKSYQAFHNVHSFADQLQLILAQSTATAA